MENKSNTLICSAFDGEIDLLIASKNFPHIRSLGIGNLEAALALFLFVKDHPEIRSVLFIGSCGAYAWSGISIGSFVSPIRTCNLEISAILGHTKQIQVAKSSIDFSNPVPIYSQVVCNAPAALTLVELPTPPTQDWKGLDVENLELYGVSRVCEMMHLSFTAHLCVTNIVSPEGSFEWQKNWRNFSSILQTEILKI